MAHKPDYVQRPPQQRPVQQQGATPQGGGAVPPTWSQPAHATATGSANAPQLGQPQHAVPPASSLGPPSAGQHPFSTTPISQTFGVSFTGTAKFAPLPFPPCEHRLPPPSSGPISPPIATMHPLPPPPPPYTERPMQPQGHLQMPAPQAQSQPAPRTGPSPMPAPAPTAPIASASHVHASSSTTTLMSMPIRTVPSTVPLVPQPTMPAPSTRPASTGVMLFAAAAPPPPPTLPQISAPIPVPVPVFVSTRPGMLPYGQQAPVLTPWPPIPLRHIDSYLAGAWPPPPPTTSSTISPMMPFAVSQHAVSPMHVASLQQKFATPSMAPLPQSWMSTAPTPQVPTTVFPVQVPMPFAIPPSCPQVPPQPMTGPASSTPAATTATTATIEKPDICMVRDCQAHSFCELSPCRCRICRDHLGWVMRGARMIDLATGEEVDMHPHEAVGEHEQQQQAEVTGTGETHVLREEDDGKSTPRLVRKMYRCTACGRQSAMETPKKPTTHDENSGVTSPRSSQVDSSAHESAGEATTREEGDGEAFSIKYFSHGPVSHPLPNSETSTRRSQPDVAPLSPSIDYAAALDPAGDASYMQYPPAILPYGPYAFVPSEEIWSDPYSSLGPGASLYWPKGYAEQYATPVKPVADPSAHPSAGSPVKEARRHSLAVKTEALEPVQRCSSAVASPTSVEPTVEVPPTTPPSRPASSPSALETGNTLESAIGRLTTRTAPSPPESVRTPSPVSSSPYGDYGSYGPFPSPPSTRDDLLEYGLPAFSGAWSSSYPLASEATYVTSPTATLGSYPFGNVTVPSTTGGEAKMYGIAYPSPGLGLTGLYTPESSLITPPRMGLSKKRLGQSGAERSKGGGKWTSPREWPRSELGAGGSASTTPYRTPYAVAHQLPPELDGSLLEKRDWPMVKIENIPFNTTLEHIEAWLPKGVLAPSSSVVLPIHLILHRASGRTLPHCYVETASHEAAIKLITSRDRAGLGDRTVRVKWERAGELLRDLFGQGCYFAKPSLSPASAPLPHLPPEGFRLPDGKLLTIADIRWLSSYCTRPINMRERPLERAFYNLASIIAHYPWERQDLWDDALRNELFDCVKGALEFGRRFAPANGPGDLFGYKRMLWTIRNAFQKCPAFTQSQKEQVRRLLERGPTQPYGAPPEDSSERDYPLLQEASLATATFPMTPSRVAKKPPALSSPETPTPIAGRATKSSRTVDGPSTAQGVIALSKAGPSDLQGGSTAASHPTTRPPVPAALSSSQGTSVSIGGEQGALGQDTARGPNAQASVPEAERASPKAELVAATPAAAAKAAAQPSNTPTAVKPEAGPARGWMATPPESPLTQRQKSIPENPQAKSSTHASTEKGWAEE